MSQQQPLFCTPQRTFLAGSAQFDGVNDYMTRGSTGSVDGKTGIFSCWFKPDNNNAATVFYGEGLSTTYFSWLIGILQLDFINVSSGFVGFEFKLGTGASTITVGAWNHLIGSWDVNDVVGLTQGYVNDISSVNVSAGSNVTLEYTFNTECTIGAQHAGLTKIQGSLAEFYFAPNQYLDLSVTANRRKFINSTLQPVYLGSDGSTPTGVAPLIYQSILLGNDPAGFATNHGSGGNFAVVGALTAGGFAGK